MKHLLICLLMLCLPMAAHAADGSVVDAIKTTLAKEPVVEVAGVKLTTAPLRSYYETRGYAPRWFGLFGLKGEAKDALAIMRKAEDEHGIHPVKTQVAALDILLDKGMPGVEGAAATAAIDILISDAVMRYAYGVGYGVTLRSREIKWGKPVTLPPPETLLIEAANASSLKEYLLKAPPQLPQYNGLKTLLTETRTLEAKGGWPAFGKGGKLEPGKNDPRVPHLRKILFVQGDLAQEGEGTLYDDVLVEAVKKFQVRHGLEADGIIGLPTANALNVSAKKRIHQILATMERMRWLPKNMGQRYVIVNVPEFMVHAYENGKEVLESRAITGRPENPTPLFTSVIDAVSFNPAWHVPAKIAREEMLKDIQEDPEYLSKGNYTVRVHDEDGPREIDPAEVDWEKVVADDSFNYSFRQEPGGGNALGKIKFNIQDSDAVYLHSTSMPKLFAKSVRAFSHGCMRVAKPRELMHFLMHGNDGWDEEKRNRFYDSDAPRIVSIAAVPVHVVYFTARRGDDGRPQFRADIYSLDDALAAALK